MKYLSLGMTFLFYCMGILQLLICVLVLEQEKNGTSGTSCRSDNPIPKHLKSRLRSTLLWKLDWKNSDRHAKDK